MNNLVFSYTEDLAQPTIDCATDYGHANKIIVSKTPVLTAGNVPSASEFANAYDTGQIVILSGFTNFSRIKTGSTEIELQDGGINQFDGQYTISGRIRKIDNAIQRLTEILTRHRILYMYYLTDRNYCFGVYKSEPRFSLIRQNYEPKYIDFNFTFYDLGIDYSLQDYRYEDLPDITSYLITEDDKKILTEDGKNIIF